MKDGTRPVKKAKQARMMSLFARQKEIAPATAQKSLLTKETADTTGPSSNEKFLFVLILIKLLQRKLCIVRVAYPTFEARVCQSLYLPLENMLQCVKIPLTGSNLLLATVRFLQRSATIYWHCCRGEE